MSELTLDALKAEQAAAEAARNEEARVAQKRLALEHLAATETRLETYVERIKERRKALKVERVTADAFLRSIEAFGDDEDATVEEIERLINSINDSFPPAGRGCAAPAAPAAPAVPWAPTSSKDGTLVTISPAQLEDMIRERVRQMVRGTSLVRGA